MGDDLKPNPDKEQVDSGEIKIDLNYGVKQRVTATLENVKPHFKQVILSPDIAIGLVNRYGSKLKDVSHAVVWKEFFVQLLEDFHPDVKVYFEKGPKGFVEIYFMGDSTEQEKFNALFGYCERYICLLFKASVEQTVLGKADLENTTITSLKVKVFFDTFKPSQTRMDMSHVQLAQYFIDEDRKLSQRSDIKKGLFVWSIEMRPEFHFVSDVMKLLKLQYTHSELDLLFQQMTLEGVKQASDATMFTKRSELLRSIQIRLQEKRERSRTDRLAFFVGGGGNGNHNKRDMSKVKCYTCDEYGHYANLCVKKNKKSNLYPSNVGCKETVPFIWDLGSDAHVINDIRYYENFTEVETAFLTVNGREAPIYSQGYGDIKVRYGKGRVLTLTDVHYIPQSGTCIFSHGEGVRDGLPTMFKDFKIAHEKTGEVIGYKTGNSHPKILFDVLIPRFTTYMDIGGRKNQRRRLIEDIDLPTQFHVKSIFSVQRGRPLKVDPRKLQRLSDLEIHRMYGHPNADQFKTIIVEDNVVGVKHVETIDCPACSLGRMKLFRPLFSEVTKITRCLELIHVDICGPFPDTAYDGSKYFITIVDDFARLTHARALLTKKNASIYIRQFINRAVAKFNGARCLFIRSDNALEFCDADMKTYIFHKGIQIGPTVPGTHHQNGLVEKKQQDLQTKMRTLLADANMPTVFWPDALRMAVHMINWTPSRSINMERPINKWNGYKTPFYSMPTFGTLAYVRIPDLHEQSKLNARAVTACYLGPAPNRAAGRFYTHHNETVFDSDQCTVNPHVFYFDVHYKDFLKPILRPDHHPGETNMGGLQPFRDFPKEESGAKNVSEWEYQTMFHTLPEEYETDDWIPENMKKKDSSKTKKDKDELFSETGEFLPDEELASHHVNLSSRPGVHPGVAKQFPESGETETESSQSAEPAEPECATHEGEQSENGFPELFDPSPMEEFVELETMESEIPQAEQMFAEPADVNSSPGGATELSTELACIQLLSEVPDAQPRIHAEIQIEEDSRNHPTTVETHEGQARLESVAVESTYELAELRLRASRARRRQLAKEKPKTLLTNKSRALAKPRKNNKTTLETTTDMEIEPVELPADVSAKGEVMDIDSQGVMVKYHFAEPEAEDIEVDTSDGEDIEVDVPEAAEELKAEDIDIDEPELEDVDMQEAEPPIMKLGKKAWAGRVKKKGATPPTSAQAKQSTEAAKRKARSKQHAKHRKNKTLYKPVDGRTRSSQMSGAQKLRSKYGNGTVVRYADIEYEELDGDIKRRRLKFLNRALASGGGLYMLAHNTEEPVGDKDARLIFMFEQTVRVNLPKGVHDDLNIDWTRTLFNLALMDRTAPKSFKAIGNMVKGAGWYEACDKEISAHKTNGTWKLVKLPAGRKPLGNMWVFTVKDNGTKKARIVVLGNHQKEGIDYGVTFSPVIRFTSLRFVMAIAAKEGLEVRQVDVTTAFLNGRLEEEIYMRQPEGYKVVGKEEYVLKLEKSLYGLKQAPHVWHETVQKVILEAGFTRSEAEPCLFHKRVNGKLVMITLYVDDMLIFGPNGEQIKKVVDFLCKRFEMKDLGVPEKFLGMNVKVTGQYIELSLCDYIEKVIDEFEQISSKTDTLWRKTKAPMSPSDRLQEAEDDDVLCNETAYRSLIGKFLYAAGTARPDIAYVTLYLSMFMIKPTEKHWKAAVKVLRYLGHTRTHSIRYLAGAKNDVTGFSDADFAMASDRKSRSGIMFRYANAPIMWLSKKQSTIATSTLSAELAALYEATREAIWMRRILGELGITQDSKTIQLWCDNAGTIATVNNKGFHERAKHEEVRVAYVQEKISEEKVKVDYVNTKDNIADMFTKALAPEVLEGLVLKSGMHIYNQGKC